MAQFSRRTREPRRGKTANFAATGSSPTVGLATSAFHATPIPRSWSVSIGRGDREKRQSLRRALCCEMAMIAEAADETETPAIVPGQCMEIGDGGLYGIVPVGYGVAIGQRYTFRLNTSERGPEPGSPQVVAQRGRIMRTELLIGPDGSGDRIGIGVRLHGPRTGIVPMPTSTAGASW